MCQSIEGVLLFELGQYEVQPKFFGTIREDGENAENFILGRAALKAYVGATFHIAATPKIIHPLLFKPRSSPIFVLFFPFFLFLFLSF
jgi:hypothetical protein